MGRRIFEYYQTLGFGDFLYLRQYGIVIGAICLASCAPESANEELHIKDMRVQNIHPRIALIIPAGAGAVQVSTLIAAQLETDAEIEKLGDAIDIAGGISSGAIIASALTQGIPTRNSASSLKDKTRELVKKTFPYTNKLLVSLKKDYGLNFYELAVLFEVLVNVYKTEPKDTMSAFALAINTASQKVPSLKAKLDLPFGLILLGLQYQDNFQAIQNFDRTRALKSLLSTLLDDTQLGNENNHKIIAFASHLNKPVFFAHDDLILLPKAPQAIKSTRLSEALLASSAIPGLFKTSSAKFKMPDGSIKTLTDLRDGAFASSGVNYDPSAILYNIYKKKFPNEKLFIIYIGNGSKVDTNFRENIKATSNDLNNRITFIAIDALIKDADGQNVFPIAQFDGSQEMAVLLNASAQRAIKSPAYKRALRVLKMAKTRL